MIQKNSCLLCVLLLCTLIVVQEIHIQSDYMTHVLQELASNINDEDDCKRSFQTTCQMKITDHFKVAYVSNLRLNDNAINK